MGWQKFIPKMTVNNHFVKWLVRPVGGSRYITTRGGALKSASPALSSAGKDLSETFGERKALYDQKQ